jgi:hypothetical protein
MCRRGVDTVGIHVMCIAAKLLEARKLPSEDTGTRATARTTERRRTRRSLGL